MNRQGTFRQNDSATVVWHDPPDIERLGVGDTSCIHCDRTTGATCHESVVEEREIERAVQALLNAVELPERIVNWLNDVLAVESELHAAALDAVQSSQIKALRVVERQIDTLTRMRLLDGLTDDEYLARRQKFLNEREMIQSKLQTDRVDQKPIELLKNTFLLATTAKNRFLAGDAAEKRYIVRSTVSNFFLKDRKALIEAQKPFRWIAERRRSLSTCG